MKPRKQVKRKTGSLEESKSTVQVESLQQSGNLVSGYERWSRRYTLEWATWETRLGVETIRLTSSTEPAYDEVDDGFAFTRTRAKRAKANPALPSTVEEDKQEPQPQSQSQSKPTKRPRKKSATAIDAPVEESEPKVRRRSPRNSSEHEKGSTDPPPLQVRKRRKQRASSEMKGDHGGEILQPPPEAPRHEASQDHTQPIEITFDATKIALPFADTPRIQRNKDMRKTNAARRSSLGLRGRRASSLIDSGKSAGKHRYFSTLRNLILIPTKQCHTMKLRTRNSTNTLKAKASQNHVG